ncbi:putative LysR family regulatory protein [Novosphingobium sp. Rr 2-17]|nr:putative LysR family regulatory protein [Novosphingobium sp. Rr 2-17]
MFVRSPGRVVPTEAGRLYAAAVAPALATLLAAAWQVHPNGGRPVSFGCSRALLNHWLLPRLTRTFDYPGLVDVVALGRTPKNLSGLDVALVHEGSSPLCEGAELVRRERLFAIGTPELVRTTGGNLEGLPSLSGVRLLGGGWDLWGRSTGVSIPPQSAIRLRETSALMAGARAGDGFALLPSLVCADDLRDGRLVMASSVTVDRKRGYWLVEPNGGQSHAAVLVAWLRQIFSALEPSI